MTLKKHLLGGLVLLSTSLLMLSCTSQGQFSYSSDTVGRHMKLRDFEKIKILGSATVYYTQSDSFSVEVKGPKKLVDRIDCSVDHQTLFIRNKNKIGIFNITMGDGDELAVYVTSPDLVSVHLSGSGDFISSRQVDTDNMSITLRGSGDITFDDIICDRCRTEVVGSGDVSVKRLECQSSDISVVGSGDVSILQWHVNTTDITLRGSGDVDVEFAKGCDRANCSLTGSGDISLKGRLNHFHADKHGSGDIDTGRLTITE